MPIWPRPCAALGRDLTAPKGITFSWQTDPYPLPDRALSLDRTAFLRAAENLLSNGVRYTPAGQTLDCGLRLTAQRLFLWVQDSGPGFSPEALAKAGKLFYTEEPNRPRAGIWGWASIPPPRPPGPTAADYAWKTPPAGAGPPCGFLFHNISAIFPKAVAFLEKLSSYGVDTVQHRFNETEADYAMNWWKPALGGLLAAGSLVPILARRTPGRKQDARPVTRARLTKLLLKAAHLSPDSEGGPVDGRTLHGPAPGLGDLAAHWLRKGAGCTAPSAPACSCRRTVPPGSFVPTPPCPVGKGPAWRSEPWGWGFPLPRRRPVLRAFQIRHSFPPARRGTP
ncbi:MAG: sensor histidine kinase [Evtepia gabavorous]